MGKNFDITVAGHICLDIIPKIPHTGLKEITDIFKPGKLVIVDKATISTGGPVSNTGIALAKLGLKVAFMARIGDDHFGEIVEKLLETQGFTSGISKIQGERTSYTIAIAPSGIDRIFLHHPGANDHFDHNDLDVEIIRQSKMFHFGYPPIMAKCYRDEGSELEKIIRIANGEGAFTSIDMALPDPDSASGKAPWPKILERVLPYVDLFIPSIEEIFYMLDREKYFQIKKAAGNRDVVDFIDVNDYQRLAQKCLDLGAQMVALKAAHKGIYFYSRKIRAKNGVPKNAENWSNRELWSPAFRIEKIASATGSGDSAIAGFLAAIVQGRDVEDALNYANCTGYQNLHELDAISGIKSWDETTQMLKERKLKKIEISLDESNWKWSVEHQLWVGAGDKFFVNI
ncbi:MAG: carbohydrate kinase family protein [Calditrichaeota bacterium]|nr:carbohydrate kinase family protein [Calditrichota bacterium]